LSRREPEEPLALAEGMLTRVNQQEVQRQGRRAGRGGRRISSDMRTNQEGPFRKFWGGEHIDLHKFRGSILFFLHVGRNNYR